MSSIRSIPSVIAQNNGNIQVPKVHSKMNNPKMNSSFSISSEKPVEISVDNIRNPANI